MHAVVDCRSYRGIQLIQFLVLRTAPVARRTKESILDTQAIRIIEMDKVIQLL
jgi:hypothetical protein